MTNAIDDVENYGELLSSMKDVGWSDQLQEDIFKIVAGFCIWAMYHLWQDLNRVCGSERSSDGLKHAAAMFGIDDIQQLGKACAHAPSGLK